MDTKYYVVKLVNQLVVISSCPWIPKTEETEETKETLKKKNLLQDN